MAPNKQINTANKIRRGSITVYLCMVLMVILSLVFACLHSAKVSAARAALSCAADEGLFSLFSNYDKTLYEKYGLMFLDGGYTTGELKIGNLVNEALEYTEKALSPSLGISQTDPKELYDISVNSAAVTGYTLATDSSYKPLINQICEIMELKVGTDAISALASKISSNAGAMTDYGLSSEDEIDALEATYEDQKELAEQYKAEKENSAASEDAEGTSSDVSAAEGVDVPDNYQNPVDNISALRQMGLMSFAIPDGKGVSNSKIDSPGLASNRTLKSGMGLLPDEERNFYEKIMVSEFSLGFFTNYLSAGSGEELQYQIEYIIAGNSKDSANLKAVMNRLLLIRMGLNFLYLYTDSAKTAEVYETAAIISTILLIPEAIEIVAQIVRAFWAYAESMMDVKSLLAGGKIPIFKDSSTWQVSLSLFSTMSSGTSASDSSRGLDYEDYLRVLMYMMNEDELIERTADMIEYNKRIADGEEDFCLDSCLSAFEIELEGSISGRSVTINRSYGYYMDY